MSGYDYASQKAALFTDDGQRQFLRIRDRVNALLDRAGAVRAGDAMHGITGDAWTMLACFDRLAELGEIVECVNPVSSFAQHRIFIRPNQLIGPHV